MIQAVPLVPRARTSYWEANLPQSIKKHAHKNLDSQLHPYPWNARFSTLQPLLWEIYCWVACHEIAHAGKKVLQLLAIIWEQFVIICSGNAGTYKTTCKVPPCRQEGQEITQKRQVLHYIASLPNLLWGKKTKKASTAHQVYGVLITKTLAHKLLVKWR